MRTLVTLACTECKRRNYTTDKNKSNNPRSHGVEEVLPVVQEAHAAQGDPLAGGLSKQASSSNG